MNEQDVQRLAPQAHTEFGHLLDYLIKALHELHYLNKRPGQVPAQVQRILTNVQDAFINISTLRSFTADVVEVVDQMTSRLQAADQAFEAGWDACYTDLRRKLKEIKDRQ